MSEFLDLDFLLFFFLGINQAEFLFSIYNNNIINVFKKIYI
jgi:hypothetical protein